MGKGKLSAVVLRACILLALFITACDNGGNPTEEEKKKPAETPKVTITFETAGGSAVDSVEIDQNSALPADYFNAGSKVPAYTGYRFNGWLNGAAPVTESTTFAQNATLTAQWVRQVTVSFNLGAGVSGNPPQPVTIDAGTALGTKYPSRTPAREGWEFDGWFNDGTEYTKDTKITTTAAAFTLTAQWTEDTPPENAQSPAIHPGNHFVEIVTGGALTVRVNTDFSANGLFSNVEPGAGVLTSQWYRATSATGEGEEIDWRQTAAAANPHELALPFTWREPAAGEYWYWVAVTNTNERATINKTRTSVTQNKLKVTVTD